jgi:hypothetical protein
MNPKRCHMCLPSWPSLIAVIVAVMAVLTMLLSQNGFAATFTVNNKCGYTIYPGIYPATYSNGGWTMAPGSSVNFTLASGWNGRIWGRKGCNGASPAQCTTGSCGGTGLQCAGTTGVAGTSLAEFNLNAAGTDWYDVSYVDGFDNPIGVVVSNGTCVSPNTCTAAPLTSCYSGDLADGGADCLSPCSATGAPQYCCAGAFGTPATCQAGGTAATPNWPAQYLSYVTTIHSACPNEYAYSYDDNIGLHTCPTGSNYTITFCPNGSGSTGGGGGGTTTEGPFGGTAATIPGTVPAENYDTGGQGVAYNVTAVNGTDNAYRSDGVDLELATAPATGNDLGWTAAGQWFRYTVNVATAGTYTVSMLVASPTAVGDAFHISNSSGTNLSGSVAVPATGGFQVWVTVKATVTLPAGTQTLTVNQDAAGWNIDSLAFAASGGGGCTAKPTAPTGLAASGTTSTGTTLSWTADTAPANCSISSYTVLKNGASIGTATGATFAVTGLAASTNYSFTVEATDAAGTSAASAALSVTTPAGGGGGGEAPYGGTAAAVPGTVLAEKYDTGGQGVAYNVTAVNGTDNGFRSDGVDLETTSAPGGGNNLGWTAAGQWFKYTVNVATAGTYTVSFVVASPTAVGDAFHISNSSGTNLSGAVAVPATGGFQVWVTVKATVTLPAGTQTLTVNQDAAGWNIYSLAFALNSSGGGGSTGGTGSGGTTTFTYSVTDDSTSLVIGFTGTPTCTSVIVSYVLNGGGQVNVTMTDAGGNFSYTIPVTAGAAETLSYYFTYIQSTGAQFGPTATWTWTRGSGGGGGTPPPPPPPGDKPFGGTAAAVPGTVLAENYDTGGQGVAYNVTAVNGTDNGYRADGVDLETAVAPATGNDLGWTANGQWFNYTVNVATAGAYTVSVLVASPTAVGDAFHISNSAGTNLSGAVAVPATGGFQTWQTVTANVTLPAGTQTLTLNQDGAGWNIDSMAFTSGSGGGGGGGGGTTGNGTNNESCAGVSPITVGGITYNPTWCLEFNGPVGPPSTTATNFDFGNNGGWGNGEQEFYCGYPGMANNPAQCPTTFSTATAPVYIDGNGHLVIQPRNVGGTWISARLNTDPAAAGGGPQLFTYGILEASIKLPDMNPQGIWPAFWGLGNNSNAGVVWPTCGETDILEDWSPSLALVAGAGDAGINSTIHTELTGGDGIGSRYLFPGGEAVNTAFHTYGQVWSANEIQYFVDNPSAPFATHTPGQLPAGDVWPFNQPFFMIMNVAVGGTLGGSDAGINPGPMTVDYIRWYAAP